MNIKIELPESYVVTSRGVEVSVDMSKLSADIVAELVQHGLQQKVADSASNAKALAEESDGETVETITESLMSAAVEALIADEWSRRTGGGGVDEFTRVARMVTRRLVKAKFGAKSEAWATFTGLETADANAKLDEWYEANAKALKPEVEAEIERRREAAEAKRKTAKAVEFDI